ncbi:hypothetical protein HDU98_000782 [Podochytrium sp. JEL0797]|nr:hypothetical protein HDU98_000782 [Podochytrium sp. JEL0797]
MLSRLSNLSSRSVSRTTPRAAGAAMLSTGTGFKEKESAHENQYVHDHDLELIKKLKVEVMKKEVEAAAARGALEAAMDAAEKIVNPIDAVGTLGGARTGQTAFGKKKDAAEEMYFRELDKEKLKKQHK